MMVALTGNAQNEQHLNKSLSVPTSQTMAVNEQDSLALVAFYNSTNGANWTNNTGWLVSPVSEWYGITVVNGRVVEISFHSNNISGSLPDELGDLTGLKILKLHNREEYYGRNGAFIGELSGCIPVSLGNLVNLEVISIIEFQLTGNLPVELCGLANLRIINFDYNQLSDTLTTELGNLLNLRELYLCGNQFTGIIPTTLGQLNQLICLSLSGNNLIGNIPVELGNLEELKLLNLCLNQLDGDVPSELRDLTNLFFLNLHENQLEGLPNLQPISSSIYYLHVNNNKFTYEDLEYNIGVTAFTYEPQDSIETIGSTQVEEGQPLVLSVTCGGTANVYQWFIDGVEIAGATDTQFTISQTSLAHAGVYHCQVNNTIATDLTIYSENKSVAVLSQPVIALSPEHHDFGLCDAGGTAERLFTIYNIGDELMTITGIELSGTGSSAFSLGNKSVPITIAGKWHYEFKVFYQPHSNANHQAEIHFYSDCCQRPHLVSNLSGRCETADEIPPELVMAFPAPGTMAVPVNVAFFWQIGDMKHDLDGSTINISVNGTPVISGGLDATGGAAQVAVKNNLAMIFYQPGTPLPQNQDVVVEVAASDMAVLPNTMDSTYTFMANGATMTITTTDTIGLNGGTVVDDSSQVKMIIPANALTDSTVIVISRIDNPPALPDTVEGLGLNLHFWPDGLQFDEAVTLCVPYTQSLLDSAGITDPMNLAIYYFSSTSGSWSQLTVVDTNATHIFVEIHEFCYLSLARSEGSSTAVVDNDSQILPENYALHQNYPNPFNPVTHIIYEVEQGEKIRLIVYDMNGRIVCNLLDEYVSAGRHEIVWNGRNESGDIVPSGVYFYVLHCGKQVLRKKCVFMK